MAATVDWEQLQAIPAAVVAELRRLQDRFGSDELKAFSELLDAEFAASTSLSADFNIMDEELTNALQEQIVQLDQVRSLLHRCVPLFR